MAKKFLKPVLAILISTVLSLVAAEAALRIWWDDRPAMGLLGVVGQGWFDRYAYINELSSRGKLPPKEKPEGVYRILALGDSHTFGMGINREEDIFPNVLARMLTQKTGIKVEVVNMGVCGANPSEELGRLKQHGLSYSPDLVLLQYFYDDTADDKDRNYHLDALKIPRWSLFLSSKSYLAGFAQFFYYKPALEKTSKEYFAMISDENYSGFKKNMDIIAEMRDISVASGADFAMVVFPALYNLEKDKYPFSKVDVAVTRKLDEMGVRWVNVLPLLMGMNYLDLFVSPMDAHPNETAHRIAAEALEPIIEPMLRAKMGKAAE